MSDNPFGDPVLSVDKKDPVGAYPSDTTVVDAAALGDYNPFEANVNLSGQIAHNPAFPPSYSALESQLSTTAELERRQKELDAKAAELARREAEQNRLAEQARRGTANNWPPLPSFCPCQPCFFIDISLEITQEYQRVVFYGYYIWLTYSILLCLNLLGALIYFAGTSRTDGGSLFGISILVCVFCVPASFVCWFRPLYKAFRSNSSINFFIFFFVFAAQIVVMCIQALGILNWGSCGWITGLSALKEHPGIGGLTLVIASIFTVLAFICSLYLIRVHHIYRSTGASFGKAREEFARGIVSDPAVRAATLGGGVFSR